MSGSEHARPVWLTEDEAIAVGDPVRAKWDASPAASAEAFANGAMEDAHFRPYGHIIAAGLKALGYDASHELCTTCSGTGWLPVPIINGVHHPSPRCEDCNAGLGCAKDPA